MTQTKQTQKTNLAEVGENIGLSEGRKLVKSFKQANPDATTGYYIGRNILDQVLVQPGCVGINFRKCLTETNQEHLVYTGVDANGKDILEFTVVTNTGDLVKKDGIVADRVWVERDLADDSVDTNFDI
ncbi:MAG: hypothetical protein ABIN93_17990 [Ginsengibacter sp.]